MVREMKDSGIEWIGEIPADWNKNKVNRIFYSIGSGTTPKSSNENLFIGDITWIQSGDINGSYLNTSSKQISNIALREYSALKIYKAPFIVMAMYGASIGNISISLVDACVNQACCVMNNNKGHLKFLFYALKAAQTHLILHSVGGGQPNISQDIIKSLWLPFPLNTAQQKIADFLDKKCSQIDTALEKTSTTIEEYKKFKQAIITKAVTKGIRGDRPMKDSGIEWIGEIPEDWEVKKIKWILNERNERSVTGNEEPLSMSQKYGIIPTKEMDNIPNMASSFIGAKEVQIGDLVFNKLKAHLGVFSVSKYDGIVSPDYAVYFTKEKNNAKFLELLFKTPQCINEFKKLSSGVGAGLTRLYTKDLFSIKIGIPSNGEQQEIADYLDKKCAAIDTLIAKKEQIITDLESYKKSLIYEYVTGKKEVC